MSLTIYDEKLTQLKKNVGGVNRTLSRDFCTVKEQLNNTDYYKIIPLFHYDSVSDIDLTGEGFLITDKTSIKYNSTQKNNTTQIKKQPISQKNKGNSQANCRSKNDILSNK